MSNWLQQHLIISLILIILLAGCGSNNQPPATTTSTTTTTSDGATTIQLVPSEQEPKVEIRVNNVKNLYALELELGFEASKLKITDADSQKEGVQLTPGTAPIADFTVKNEATSSGTINYVVTQMAPREGFNGNGVVATITLAEKLTDPAAISIKRAILVNQDGQPITATIQN